MAIAGAALSRGAVAATDLPQLFSNRRDADAFFASRRIRADSWSFK
jgi:hypothetical protein